MTKIEFIKNVIFQLYKDKPFGDTRSLKIQFTKLLNCNYEDSCITDCFVKITNYQIKKYGHTLYCSDIILKRR